MTLQTIALELVPPAVERGDDHAAEEAHKVVRAAAETGLDGRIDHVMIPGIIEEDGERPVPMTAKYDVLDFWNIVAPHLPDVRGLCTQVTAFSDEATLRGRVDALTAAGMEGVAFVGVPRTMSDGQGHGVAPTDALSLFRGDLEHRGVILIPTRESELGRFAYKLEQGATYGMTQMLYSDAIVGFLAELARTTDQRPEILLSFGFVPGVEAKVGLIDWLIQDPGNAAVAAEQEFVRTLAGLDPAPRRAALVDLYKKVVDGVGELGFPLSVHFEATYGNNAGAFTTFAAMLDHWSPRG